MRLVRVGGLGSQFEHIKKMAGINTTVTGVGTVAGGVALGTGIAKANVDTKIRNMTQQEFETQLSSLRSSSTAGTEITLPAEGLDALLSKVNKLTLNKEDDIAKRDELNKLNQKSKTLGNIRTGALATGTVANIAGTAISVKNRVDADLQTQITNCLDSLKQLNSAYMQVRIDNPDNSNIQRAERIVSECTKIQMIDVDKINKTAGNATISSGIGAGTGLVGTITSVLANSSGVRNGDATKEKKMNTTANVMAGGTAVASGVATIFNASQIKAAKNAVEIIDKCQEVLK